MDWFLEDEKYKRIPIPIGEKDLDSKESEIANTYKRKLRCSPGVPTNSCV